ncbi:hypothetical protein HUS82_31645 [Pseudomonas protegens]|uniref:hypothetical protein n=1 Tax=Pseudomonas protegens TaxID=380021 RepID=UPI001B32E57E|nr:hypothetical protein [Pseudomonas protegens]MBP5114186.1 hypothetical protein [Pseudomonas protegens]
MSEYVAVVLMDHDKCYIRARRAQGARTAAELGFIDNPVTDVSLIDTVIENRLQLVRGMRLKSWIVVVFKGIDEGKKLHR